MVDFPEGYEWVHPTLTPEEWLKEYTNREKKPKPWTEEEWMKDWTDAIIAKLIREVLNK